MPTAHRLEVTVLPGLEVGFCWGPGCLGSAEEAPEETTRGERKQKRSTIAELFKAVVLTSLLPLG